MNTALASLIGVIVALVGGFVGHTTTQRSADARLDARIQEVSSEQPSADDYLSLRPALMTLPSQGISAAEREDLLYVREEEKLARDVYQTLHEQWNLPIFSNIAQSEQTHTEAVRQLLSKYGIADPVTDDTVGVFQNAELAALYTALVAEGMSSIENALTVGAKIEDLDIADLEARSAHTDNEDITLVFGNLTRGSRNHLRSFTSQLSRYGVAYTPSYLSADAYQSIINAPRETGASQGGGQGGQGAGGRGWGRSGR